MRARVSTVLLSLATLTACGETVEDSGRACLIAKELTCECVENCPPSTASMTSASSACSGLYPPADDFEVSVFLRDYSSDVTLDPQCDVELVGDHELLITSSYRDKSDINDAIDEPVFVSCPVPALEQGTWTLRYASNSTTLEVGAPDPQPLACVEGNR